MYRENIRQEAQRARASRWQVLPGIGFVKAINDEKAGRPSFADENYYLRGGEWKADLYTVYQGISTPVFIIFLAEVTKSLIKHLT